MKKPTKRQAPSSPSLPKMRPIKLENLEPRVLLAADVLVQNPLEPVSSGVSVSAQNISTSASASDDSQITDSLLDRAATHPLEVVSANGSVQEVAQIDRSNGTLQLAAGSTLVGRGDLGAGLLNQGVVSPGASPGLLSVTSFEQAASATLHMELGGLQAGVADGYDQVQVSGLANLSGTLELALINDFQPTSGQVFDVLKWSQRSGSFSSYKGLYAGNGIFLKPVYLADRLQLVATPLPGISSLSLPDVPQAKEALDTVLTAVSNTVTQAAVTLDASVDLAGLRIAGQWRVSVAPLAGGGVETTFAPSNVSALWTGAGMKGELTGLQGSLVWTGSSYSLSLQGHGRVVLPTGDALSGDFSVTKDTSTGGLQVQATGVSAQLGDPARGAALSLTQGSLSMSLQQGAYQLSASGVGALLGSSGSSFTGTLSYVANSSNGSARFEARNAQLVVQGLGALSGDFAFAARESTTSLIKTQELLVGVRNLQASLTLGEASLSAQQGWLAVVMATDTAVNGVGDATHTLAVAGEVDATLLVDNALTLTGQRVRLAMNPGAVAVSRELLSVGDPLLIDLAPQTLQIAGYFSASIQGVLSFSGDLVLDVSRTTRLLSNGQSVKLTEYALLGSRVTAQFAAGTASGLQVAQANMALVYAKDVASTRSWLTTRGDVQSLSVGGYALANVESAQWSINRAVSAAAVAEGSTLDWSVSRRLVMSSGKEFLLDQVGQLLSVPVTGTLALGDSQISGTFALLFNGVDNSWSLTAADAQVLMAAGPAFVRLTQASGSLRWGADRSRSGSLSGQLSGRLLADSVCQA
jgi:hypothetical protein